MKKLKLLIPVLLVAFFLSGCRFFLPMIYLDLSRPEESTQPEPLPIGSDVPAHLDGEDIFYRAVFAVADRAYQYTENVEFDLVFRDERSRYPVQLDYNREVILSAEDCAVNVLTEVAVEDILEEPSVQQEYYRDEDGRLIYYCADEENQIYLRREIPLENYTPYAIILDFSITGCPEYGTDITLEPQTRILDGREVYMLTFPQPATHAFGTTSNPVTNEKLYERTIPTTWYVDAQTNLPVKQEFTLTKVDDLLWQVLVNRYGLSDPDVAITLDSLHWSYTYTSCEPVPVPEIPQEVQQKAWENAGGSVS